MPSFVTVVSGLPRSGTSLMMAALAAGGLPLIVDGQRQADAHNPHGYFESERVLGLREDADWLHGREGTGVKILSHLLPAIPPSISAKVLFMRRPLPQVLASQNAMLGQTAPPSENWGRLLARDLAATLAWLETQPHLHALEVSYPRLLESPREEFARVLAFLGLRLDLEAMIATVDTDLFRQRSMGPDISSVTNLCQDPLRDSQGL